MLKNLEMVLLLQKIQLIIYLLKIHVLGDASQLVLEMNASPDQIYFHSEALQR